DSTLCGLCPLDPAECSEPELRHALDAVDDGVCVEVEAHQDQPAQLGFESLALRFPAARNDDAGTVLRKGQSGGATDAREGSCDENDWLIHLRSSSCFHGPI